MDTGDNGYKILMTENNIGKIGSYAEVLKQRFPAGEASMHSTGATSTGQIGVSQASTYGNIKTRGVKVNHHTTTIGFRSPPKSLRNTDGKKELGNNESQASYANGSAKIGPVPKDTQRSRTVQQDQRPQEKGNLVQAVTRRELPSKLDGMERRFQEQITSLESNNKKLLQEMEGNLEERMDKMLESKLRMILNLVSNSVTNKLTIAMKKMLTDKQVSQSSQDTDETLITQESPQKLDTDNINRERIMTRHTIQDTEKTVTDICYMNSHKSKKIHYIQIRLMIPLQMNLVRNTNDSGDSG